MIYSLIHRGVNFNFINGNYLNSSSWVSYFIRNSWNSRKFVNRIARLCARKQHDMLHYTTCIVYQFSCHICLYANAQRIQAIKISKILHFAFDLITWVIKSLMILSTHPQIDLWMIRSFIIQHPVSIELSCFFKLVTI